MAENGQAKNVPISASLDSEFELDLCDSELPSEKALREKALLSPEPTSSSGSVSRTPAEGSSMNPVVLDDSQATDNDSIYFDAADSSWNPQVLPDLPDYEDDEVEVLGTTGREEGATDHGKGARGCGNDGTAGPSRDPVVTDGVAGKDPSPGKTKSNKGKGSRSVPYAKGHMPPGCSNKGKQPARKRSGSPPRSPGSPITESLNLIDSHLETKRVKSSKRRGEIYREHVPNVGPEFPDLVLSTDDDDDDDDIGDITSNQKDFWTSGVASSTVTSDPVIHPGVGRTKYEVTGGTNFRIVGQNVSVGEASSMPDGAAAYGLGGPNISVLGPNVSVGRASVQDKSKPNIDKLLQTIMDSVTSGKSKEYDPLANRNVVWTGMLEWKDKSNPCRSLGCKVSTSKTQPAIDASNWPSKLTMQMCPAHFLNNDQLMPLMQDARKVRLHFQTIATPADMANMTALCHILGSDSGFAGCVHFPRSSMHNMRVLLLLFHSKIKSFVGLIPNDQQAVIDKLRHMITEHKRIHQGMGAQDGGSRDQVVVDSVTQSSPQQLGAQPGGSQTSSLPATQSSLPFQAPTSQDNFEDASILAAHQAIANTMSATANAASGIGPESTIEVLCEACQLLYGHNSMVECNRGHIICRQCVETAAKAVLVGDTKGSVVCSNDWCNSSIPQSELRKALPSIVMDLLEERWKKETMEALEDMKDVVKCAVCGFSGVLDMSIKQFECLKCKKSYCRYCEMEWHQRQHDLCFKTKTRKRQDTGAPVQIPAHWSEEGEKEVYTNVELSKDSREYQDIAVMFATTLHGHKVEIQKIYRIQNLRLWDRFSLTRSHMVEDLGELHLREMRLFHGTQPDVAYAICQEGFDWRLCGKNGTAYGKGTYFAKHAATSLSYSGKDLRGFTFGANIGGSGFSFLGRTVRQRLAANTSGFIYGPQGPGPPAPSSGVRYPPPVSNTTTTSTGFNFGPAVAHFPSSSGLNFGTPVTSSNAQSTGFNFAQPVGSSGSGAPGYGPGSNPTHPGSGVAGSSSMAVASANFWNNQQSSNWTPRQDMPLPHPNLPSTTAGPSATSGSQTSMANTSGFIFYPHASSGPSQGSQSGFSSRPSTGSNLFVRPLNPRSQSGVSAVPSGSSSRATGDSTDHLMFVGRVLVGRTCQGHPEMRRPGKDPHDPEGAMCHSAVNNVHNPNIFVIFDMAQCYPEYLIKYS